MIRAEIDARDISQKIGKFTPKIKSKLKTLVRIAGREWQSYIRNQFFTGYSYGKKSDLLQSRTSFLRRSIIPAPANDEAEGIAGGVLFGASYAKVHVGPKGQETTITPKTRQYLTIPLKAAMTGKGEVRGKATDESVWGETFVQKNSKGNLIIYGQRVISKGANAGSLNKNITPLFVLKRLVKIKTRIHPEVIFKWATKKLADDIRKAFAEA